VISTADPDLPEDGESWPARGELTLEARSLVVLRRAW
jgi:hypothetical protein